MSHKKLGGSHTTTDKFIDLLNSHSSAFGGAKVFFLFLSPVINVMYILRVAGLLLVGGRREIKRVMNKPGNTYMCIKASS